MGWRQLSVPRSFERIRRPLRRSVAVVLMATIAAMVHWGCYKMTAELNGLYSPDLHFKIDRSGWWLTERHKYFRLLVKEGVWQALTEWRWPTRDNCEYGEVFIRMPAKAVNQDLAVPGQAEGYLFLWFPEGPPLARRFSGGKVSVAVNLNERAITAEVELAPAVPTEPRAGGPDADHAERREALKLSKIIIAESDRGIPAYLFKPQYVDVAPELKTWLEDDPELGNLVRAIP